MASHRSVLPLKASTLVDSVRGTIGGWNDKIVQGIKKVSKSIRREAKLTYGTVQSDIPVTIVLGTVSTIAFALARNTPLTFSEFVAMLTKSIIWFFFYGYQFNIGNQMNGVEEDRLNSATLKLKASRPLATGEMTMEEGKVREVLARVAYMAISILWGGTELSLCALLWILTSHGYNGNWGWDSHFVTKNWLSMSTGSIAMLLAARNLAGEMNASMIPPIVVATWNGFCMDSQDLRDEAGDRQTGRRTTAVLFGVQTARKVYVATAAVATGIMMYAMRSCAAWPDFLVVGGIVAHFARTLTNKSVQDDELTYNEICLAGFFFFCRSAVWARTF